MKADASGRAGGGFLKLILVRHGQTHWNEERRVQGGGSDIELNDTGLEQARKLGIFLRSEPVVAVVSSPLKRALATAQVIADHHRLPVEVAPGLGELRIGELEGMSLANLGTTFSQFLIRWWQGKEARDLQDGETLVEVQDRAWKVIEAILKKHRDGAVVVVSHYFVILAIVLKALGLSVDCFTRFKVDPGGVSILEFGNYGVRLVTFNDTSY